MKGKLRPPVVLTKLQPPIPARDVIARHSLADFSERVLSHRLTLVCAAAGYGKTTLLSTLREGSWPLAWYSLGRSDADPVVFLHCLVEGLRLALQADAEPLFKNKPSRARTRDDLEVHLANLVNGLSQVPVPHIVIVLDDFHLVEDSKSLLWSVNHLIASLPANCHLVLSSRTNFSIPSVPKLRVSGQVLDVREYTLRFDSEEALELLEKSLRVSLPRHLVDSLVEQMEGWPIGLRLAGQSLAQRPVSDAEGFLSQLCLSDQPLFEYLAEEVLSRQPAEIQWFLLQSSVLTRLDEDTCNAVLGRQDSGQMLQRVLQGNLFLSVVDSGLYRYHQLFRDFLRQRLSQEHSQFTRTHEAAASHYQQAGEVELAIYHLLAAKKHHQAAALMVEGVDWLVRTSRFDTLSFWVQQLPDSVLDQYPELLFRRGEIDHIRGRYDSSLHWYDRAARVYRASEDMVGLSRILQRKGRILNWRVGEPLNAQVLHSQALAFLGEENQAERAALLADLARDRMSAGELDLGFQFFHQAVQVYEALGDAGREGLLATLINPGAWLYFDRGDFCQSIALLQKAASLAAELDCKHQLAECYNTMSSHLFLWGKGEESRAYANKALELCRELGSDFGRGVAMMNLANIIEDEKDSTSDEYLQWHQRALEIFETAGNRRFCIATLNFMSAACRHRGAMIEAARYAHQAYGLANTGTAPWLTAWATSSLGVAKIDSGSEPAISLLERAADTFQNYGDRHNLTLVHLWLATAWRRVNDARWIDHLRICLQLSKDGGYSNTLKREKRFSLPLLIEALRQGVERDYAGELLADFGDSILDNLLPIIEVGDRSVCLGAIRILSTMKSTAAWKALFGLTRHPDEIVRSSAGSTLLEVPPPRPPLLDIYSLGPFQVYLGARAIGEDAWKRKKVKSFLKYLANCPGACASKDAIVDALWPDLDPDAGNNNFYRTLHHVRRLLDQESGFAGSGYVPFDGGLVRLAPELIARIDVEDFERFVRNGRDKAAAGDFESARVMWEAAIQLYRGDYLADDPYEDWTQARRENLRDRYVSTLVRLSELHAERRQWEIACNYLRRILAADVTREDIHLRLMRVLVAAGNHSEAIKQYRRCERALKEELEADPARETKTFFEQLAHSAQTNPMRSAIT